MGKKDGGCGVVTAQENTLPLMAGCLLKSGVLILTAYASGS